MIAGPALIVISQCIDGHPNGARAVLTLGIIVCVCAVIRFVVEIAKKMNQKE
jgi:hypothetical protein